jgi:hypothetical protein
MMSFENEIMTLHTYIRQASGLRWRHKLRAVKGYENALHSLLILELNLDSCGSTVSLDGDVEGVRLRL